MLTTLAMPFSQALSQDFTLGATEAARVPFFLKKMLTTFLFVTFKT